MAKTPMLPKEAPAQRISAIWTLVGALAVGAFLYFLLSPAIMTVSRPAAQPPAAVPTAAPYPTSAPDPTAAPYPTSIPAFVPSEHVVEFQPAPPADVPIEDVQERVEVIQVDRAPEQTTIIRTVPQKPSGAPIVIDGGVKRMGAP
jgi:hypothetical protein